MTDLSLNALDVLTGLDTVKICTAYRYQGRLIEEFPASLNVLAACEPVYEEMPGWQEDITSARSLNDLPDNARRYLERITEFTGISLALFSVGPDRAQTNVIRNVYAT